MSESINRGGLRGRLASHFAACAGTAAVAVVAGTAAADVSYQQVDWVIPATTYGAYIKVDTFESQDDFPIPGWDLNPWGTSSLLFWWVGSTAECVLLDLAAGGAGSTLSQLPLGFSVGPTLEGASWGTASPSFTTTAPGKWNFNGVNHFGFRFDSDSGARHYGWARMEVGATATTRRIIGIAWETTPDTPITVGDEGGGAPPYDPCAPFNPSLAVGSNNLQYRDTAPNLALSGCGGTAFVANYYKFVAPASGSYTFSTCDSGAATRMAVLDGCAAGSAQLACNDNGCGNSSTITITLNQGLTYYVAIGADSAGSPLTSPVVVRVDGPPNPACVSAVAAVFGANAFDNAGSTTPQVVKSNLAGTTSATINKSVWYAFTPTVTGAYSFTMCSANGDTMIAIGEACPSVGGRFECIAFNDDSTCTSGVSRSIMDATNGGSTSTFAGFPLTQDLVAGTTYYIVAGAYSAASLVGSIDIDGPPPVDCRADIDGSGAVDGTDLTRLLAAWGTNTPDCDLDDTPDGNVGGTDLTVLLAAWGPCSP